MLFQVENPTKNPVELNGHKFGPKATRIVEVSERDGRVLRANSVLNAVDLGDAHLPAPPEDADEKRVEERKAVAETARGEVSRVQGEIEDLKTRLSEAEQIDDEARRDAARKGEDISELRPTAPSLKKELEDLNATLWGAKFREAVARRDVSLARIPVAAAKDREAEERLTAAREASEQAERELRDAERGAGSAVAEKEEYRRARGAAKEIARLELSGPGE